MCGGTAPVDHPLQLAEPERNHDVQRLLRVDRRLVAPVDVQLLVGGCGVVAASGVVTASSVVAASGVVERLIKE
jgi:hypothetical protein